jgi:hypothetical protein
MSDDRPIEGTPQHFRDLVREPCLLATDLLAIGHAEPDTWRRFASTAEYSMCRADWYLPFLVVRTHTEEVDGSELVFVLLAMRPEDEDQEGVLFGELACSPGLYARHVKRFGLERPVPREARFTFADQMAPSELDRIGWKELLDPDPDDDPEA